MSLYRSHGGAFTHQPLMCRAVPCSWNVTHARYTYGRPWYLPQGWLADLLEDLNILWARENWICQGAVLLLCASFQLFDTDMSLCPSQWEKMRPLSDGKEQRWHPVHSVTHETEWESLPLHSQQIIIWQTTQNGNWNNSVKGTPTFQSSKLIFKCISFSSNKCF